MDSIKLWCSRLECIWETANPVRVGNSFRIQSNSELYKPLNDMDVVQRINIQRLDHVVRMKENAPMEYLRKLAKVMNLFALEGPNRRTWIFSSSGS